MLKKVFTIGLFTVSLMAQTNYEKAYVELSKINENELIKFQNDEIYKKANEYIQNDSFKQVKKVNSSDPHITNSQSLKKEVLVPDYNKALEYYYESALKNKNPLSAYAGNYIIKTFTNKQGFEQLKKFTLFAEVLYSQNKRICQSYLDMGEVFENGYLRKKDNKKAWEIYNEGLKDVNCTKGWASSLLTSKKIKLERF